MKSEVKQSLATISLWNHETKDYPRVSCTTDTENLKGRKCQVICQELDVLTGINWMTPKGLVFKSLNIKL